MIPFFFPLKFSEFFHNFSATAAVSLLPGMEKTAFRGLLVVLVGWCYRLCRSLGFGACVPPRKIPGPSSSALCRFAYPFRSTSDLNFLQYFGLEKKVELVLLYVSILFVLSSNTRWPTSSPSSSMILTPGPMENSTKSRMER